MGDKSIDNLTELNDAIVAEHIIRTGELSYKMEMERGDSLSSLATKLLTAISIASIALITLFPTLYEVDSVLIPYAYVFVFHLLLCSFILCLISQYRFRYKTLVSPKDVAEQIISSNEREPFLERTDSAKHFCDSIRLSYESLRNNNNISKSLLIAVIIILVVDAAAILLIMWVWSIISTVA